MRVSSKITATIAAISIGSIVLMNALLCMKYRSTLNNFASKRYDVLATGMRSNIESAIAIGFALDNAPSIQESIINTANSNKDVMSIKIFHIENDKAITKFDTRLAGIGGEIPLPVIEQIKKSKGKSITFKDQETYVVALAIKDAFQRIVGGIQIRYKVSEFETQISHFSKKMWKYTLFICIITLLICLAFVRFIMLPLKRLSVNPDDPNEWAQQIDHVLQPTRDEIQHAHQLLDRAIHDVGVRT